MTTRPFIVIGYHGADSIFIGEAGRVEVQASTHKQATDLARDMPGWPKGCTFVPRLLDNTSYRLRVVDSDFSRFDAMPRIGVVA